MGGAVSAALGKKAVADEPEEVDDGAGNEQALVVASGPVSRQGSDEETGVDDDVDLGGFTIEGQFDDAPAGTDVHVLRILRLSQKEKNDNLLQACFRGDEGDVALLLQHGASATRHDWQPFDTPYQLAKDGKHRWSPLHAAAFSGRRQVVHLLLARGAPVNRANGWLRSPLHVAAGEGRRSVVQLLLAHGANPNGADWQKHAPLHCAVAQGHRAAAHALLEAGADPNARTLSANTPLHLAARRGRTDVALLLIDHGAQVNAAAKKVTPLHEAAKAGHAPTVALLVAHGADVGAQTAQRQTALTFAVLQRDAATEALLVGAGAFAAHLVPAGVDDAGWADMDALLEAEEGHGAKHPVSAKSKFKSLSIKVAALA